MAPAETQIRRFVSGQLRDCPDLSTLTLGILRGRYLACVGRDSLSQEDRQLMKRVVEEELMRMQDSDSSDNDAILDVTPTPRLNKRKRGEEKTTANGGWTKADGSKAKRSRLQSAQSDSPDSRIERVGNGERPREEEEEKDMGSDVEDEQVPQIGTKKNAGRHKGKHNGGKMEMSSEGEIEIKTVNQRKTELASDEEDEEEVDENKKKKQGDRKQETDKVNSDSDSEEDKEQNRRRRTTGGKDVKVQSKGWKGNRRRESGNEEKGKPVRRRERVQADGSDLERIGEAEVIEQKMVERPSNDNGSTSESEGEKNDCGASSEEASGGEEETEEVMAKTKDEPAPDSDSGSSLPSLEDEQESEVRPEQVKKRKPVAKQPVKGRGSERGSKGGKEDEAKAVARLRRYIALCGARRNFKKLLDGCRSIKSKVAVLKRELEELGVEGQPSIEKCKRARLKREEAQELADLDVSNIITTQGRPKRRGSSIWQQQSSPPSSAYKRVVNSSSDSEEDSHAGRGRKRATDWSNLKGIISDGADSD